MCLATACHADQAPAHEAGDLPELGLMGTIPIYWGEAGDVSEVLSGGSQAHWARPQLERQFELRPLDSLDEVNLVGLDFVMLAQPRALSPAENVALDNWVRKGGRVLLFADPLLTGESRFAIGDRRRPQDVILISPILNHWGLELAFDDSVALGDTLVRAPSVAIPVNLPGSLAVTDTDSDCALLAGDVVAQCSVGEGRVVVLADAALLDIHDTHPEAVAALTWLTKQAFGRSGENAGTGGRSL
jgi:hypothetical protein